MAHLQDEKTEASASLALMQSAEDFLRKMTIEEKAMQLSCLYPMSLIGTEGLIRSQLDTQLGQGIGHIAGLGTFGHKTPETIARTVNAVQRYLVTQTPLKIPAIFHNEALNGVVAPHFMHFPKIHRTRSDLASRGRGRDGKNPTASVTISRPSPGASARHGRCPRCPLGTGA
jgi:hypothetical protein